jgi:glycosyltransferase involved in cell wall biosynthesis
MIKLSIITINLNNHIGLERTIKSVISQSYRNFEYIIIDGKSIDGSINKLHDLDKLHLPHIRLQWVSSSDSGVYNALNKGIRMASGEYLLFLNSGDFLHDENTLLKFGKSNLTEDIIVGDVIIKENYFTEKFKLEKVPKAITANYLFYNYLPHPSSFLRRTFFDKVGFYNEEYRIVSDWEFFLKALLLHGASYNVLGFPVGVFITDGLSCNPANAEMIEKEKQNVLFLNFPYFYPDYINYNLSLKELNSFKESIDYKLIEFFKYIGLMHFLNHAYKIIMKLKKLFNHKKVS